MDFNQECDHSDSDQVGKQYFTDRDFIFDEDIKEIQSKISNDVKTILDKLSPYDFTKFPLQDGVKVEKRKMIVTKNFIQIGEWNEDDQLHGRVIQININGERQGDIFEG